LQGLRPDFHMHMSVSDLIILHILLHVDQFLEYVNRSQTHKWGNWDWGRAIPFLGIHKWDFRFSVGREMNASFF
jgi:hypothetical protein